MSFEAYFDLDGSLTKQNCIGQHNCEPTTAIPKTPPSIKVTVWWGTAEFREEETAVTVTLVCDILNTRMVPQHTWQDYNIGGSLFDFPTHHLPFL